MNNILIILASGRSKRFKAKKLKQFISYRNKPLYQHSIDKAIKSKIFKKIILVINSSSQVININPKIVKIVKGGKERSDSSLIGLKCAKKFKPKNILIHDAARPNFSQKLLFRIIRELKKHKAVIPIVESKDSVKYKINKNIYNLNKKKILLTQTPQAFRFNELYKLANEQKKTVSDEATLYIDNNYKIRFISGEKQNDKITFLDDIKTSKTYFGIGFDIHKLIKKKKLYLGGISIPYHSGLKGHSDGDVILHAIIDAILGATRKKDIGTHFPNSKNYKNIRSYKMLEPIMKNLDKHNFLINNLDINLICEQPKVSKYRDIIINSISKLTNVNKDQINLKGKTVEKLGLIGKEKAIACEVIVSITKYD